MGLKQLPQTFCCWAPVSYCRSCRHVASRLGLRGEYFLLQRSSIQQFFSEQLYAVMSIERGLSANLCVKSVFSINTK